MLEVSFNPEREAMLKQGELNFINMGWESLKKGDLESTQEAIMSVLESYNTGTSKTTDLWAIKYYVALSTPENLTELEKLAKAYLDKANERIGVRKQEKVSYFSKYELGIIDELFDNWKKLTNHDGQNASKVFIGWLKSNLNNLEERMSER